jgi:hypothetical protein
VDVINPTERFRYSLFGTLDVAADTQYVRVEPLGDTTRIGALPELEGDVALQNLDTGERIPLRDSFDTVSGGLAQVHNVWTSHPIQPATTYRLLVEEQGDPVTTATTTTPSRAPTLRHNPDRTEDRSFRMPCELNSEGYPLERENTFDVRVRDVEHIASVRVIYTVERPVADTVLARTFRHLDGVAYDEEQDLYRVSVFYGKDMLALRQRGATCLPPSQLANPYATVIVAAGGPDWPDWRGEALNELARPDTFSNVEGGHGFVGGIYSDTLRVPVQMRE